MIGKRMIMQRTILRSNQLYGKNDQQVAVIISSFGSCSDDEAMIK